MEVTNGLIANLVETKSMEMVLAPIASQVSQLIMMCESKAGWQPSGRLVQSADSVRQVIMQFIETAKRKSDRFNDQTFKSDMETSCEMLAQTADNFYASSGALLAAPHNPALRRGVIQASKEVLQGTMKLLLIADESEVKAIGQAAEKVRGQMRSLVAVTTMSQLVAMFRSFTESVVLLTQLATRRQKELVHPRQREKVIMGLGVLKKAVPLLSVALQGYVKHAANAQAKVSRDYAIRQMETGLCDITDAVANRFTSEDYLSLEESGFFVSRLDQLLESLAETGRGDIAAQFEMWTQDVVTHSMSVAHLCTDGQRDVIISSCQRILLQKGRLGELWGSTNIGTATEDLKRDYDEVCECLIDDLCDLERHVNLATLDLVVATFWRTTETLDTLARTAMEQTLSGGDSTLLLNEAVKEFEEHADKVCQVASLAAASSTDARRVRSIRLCIHRLEQLDPEIVPAAMACLKSRGDKLAVQHMRLLKEEWRHEFEDLLRVLDDMTDPRIFMDVSQEQLSREVNACNGLLLLEDVKELAAIFPSVSGKVARVIQVAKRLVDDHEDPLYRNGLLVYVDRLRKVVVGTGEALSRLFDDPDSNTERETFKWRLQRVPEGVGLVRAALDSHAHPDLLSPLRLQSRQTSRGRLPDEAKWKPSPQLRQSESPTTLKDEAVTPNPHLSNPPPYWSAERLKDETRRLSSLSIDSGTPKKLSVSFNLDPPDDQNCGSGHPTGTKEKLKTTGTNTPPLVSMVMTGKPQTSVTCSEDSLTLGREDVIGGNGSSRVATQGSNPSDLAQSPRSVRKSRSLSPALRPRVSKSPENTPKDVIREPENPANVQHFEGSPSDSRTGKPAAEKMSPKWKSPQRGKRETRLPLPELSDLDTPIVGVAREMSRLNEVMSQFSKSTVVPMMTGSDLLNVAKSLSLCGRRMLDFLKTIANHSLHKRFSEDLFYHIHHLSMAAVQLDIISSVSVSSAEDRSTDEMLVKAAGRLMTVTGQALRSAESAAVKGLRKPSTPEATQHVDSLEAVAGWWKGKWDEQRHLQAANSNAIDELGLRRVGLHDPPSLAQLLLPGQGT